jgi:pyruvate dehydrogenase E2 component (dihydrolipoamide acetyltransferase)
MADIVTMPKLGFDMAEGTLVRWVVQEGEPVSKGAVLAEIETDKATVEVESHHEGYLYQHLTQVGEIVPINTPIAIIAEKGEEVDINQLLGDEITEKPTIKPEQDITLAEKTAEITPQNVTKENDERLPGGLKASPLARRISSEMGIDLNKVAGTGAGGRITKKDVQQYITTSADTRPKMAEKAREVKPMLAATSISPKETKIIPLNRLRAAIGKRMTEAKQQTPHFYVTHLYEMEKLFDLRKQYNELLPEEEKTSVNDYIVKAVALALREYPNLNASIDEDNVIQHGDINIGIAVAVEGGLLTVVSKNADLKTIQQIGIDTREMVSRAREGKVKPDDIEGSTFTVSNMGMYDVEHFTAIINPPEAAILAVGSAREVPVVKGGDIAKSLQLKATISVDHRVSDGAEAARFLQSLAGYLENPLRLFLLGK